MIEQRCQNPHPHFPDRVCNTLQEISVKGNIGEGTVEVRCRRCKCWVTFFLKTEVLTGSTA